MHDVNVSLVEQFMWNAGDVDASTTSSGRGRHRLAVAQQLGFVG
jgi:hypothetical protein